MFGLIFALALQTTSVASPAQPPVKTTVERIAEQRRPIARDGSGTLSGAAWAALVDDAAAAQFTMVGEQHGAADIADFELQLERALIDRGYTNAAFEVGPYSTAFAESLIRRQGPDAIRAYLAQPEHGFTLPFFFFRNELPLPGQMVARSPDRLRAIWGLDQEFVGSGPILVDLLRPRATNAVQRTVVANFAKRVAKPDAVGGLVASDIDPIAAAFPSDRQVKGYVAALRKTVSIYRPFVHGGPGYPANLERETYMKQNFLAEFTSAWKRQKNAPKVFLKFGAYHGMRGFSGTNVPTLSNFLAEWGGAQGFRLANVLVDCLGGDAMSVGGPQPCESLVGRKTMLGAGSDAKQISIVDLKPLRAQLGAMKDLDADSRQIILAYDYYVSIPHVSPSTFVNPPKL